jgi:hypothetical protein
MPFGNFGKKKLIPNNDFNQCEDCLDATNGYQKCFKCKRKPLNSFEKSLVKIHGHHCPYHYCDNVGSCMLCRIKREEKEPPRPLCGCASGMSRGVSGCCGRCS